MLESQRVVGAQAEHLAVQAHHALSNGLSLVPGEVLAKSAFPPVDKVIDVLVRYGHAPIIPDARLARTASSSLPTEEDAVAASRYPPTAFLHNRELRSVELIATGQRERQDHGSRNEQPKRGSSAISHPLNPSRGQMPHKRRKCVDAALGLIIIRHRAQGWALSSRTGRLTWVVPTISALECLMPLKDGERPKRVLIVEDEALIALVIADALEEGGLEVADIAETLDEARVAADELDFDAAVIDVGLRGTQSYSAAELIVERGIPVIFLSGHDAGQAPAALSQVPHLLKPCGPEAVTAAVETALRSTV